MFTAEIFSLTALPQQNHMPGLNDYILRRPQSRGQSDLSFLVSRKLFSCCRPADREISSILPAEPHHVSDLGEDKSKYEKRRPFRGSHDVAKRFQMIGNREVLSTSRRRERDLGTEEGRAGRGDSNDQDATWVRTNPPG